MQGIITMMIIPSFSMQFHYITKKICYENKENLQLQDMMYLHVPPISQK